MLVTWFFRRIGVHKIPHRSGSQRVGRPGAAPAGGGTWRLGRRAASERGATRPTEEMREHPPAGGSAPVLEGDPRGSGRDGDGGVRASSCVSRSVDGWRWRRRQPDPIDTSGGGRAGTVRPDGSDELAPGSPCSMRTARRSSSASSPPATPIAPGRARRRFPLPVTVRLRRNDATDAVSREVGARRTPRPRAGSG